MGPRWYDKCPKVPWQPPNYVFGIVWPILYALYAITFFLERKQPESRNLLLIGIVMNLAWVPLYAFNVVLALFLLSGMIYIAVKTIYALKRSHIILFAPYLAWICFAWTLNAYLAVTCN
jgi:tryptophan-rich sensory protein